MSSLPKSWAVVPLGLTGEFINGFAFKPTDRSNAGLPIIRIQNLTDSDKPLNTTTRKVPDEYLVVDGDILVSWSATLDTFIWKRGPALLNQHIFKAVPNERLISRSFAFYLLKQAISEMIETEHLHGSTMKHINRGPFLAHEVPLPPLGEQERIVAALDERLSELDASVASLERAERNLVRYRAAVLAAACSGKLVPTEADLARRAGRRYEPADQLLARILAERRKANTKAKYEEPAQPDTSKLPKLPEGWVWAHLTQVAWLSGGLTKGQKRKDGQETRAVPYLRVANVQRGHLDLEEVKTIEATPEEIEDLRLVRGDILFNEGGDRDKLGRGWVWEAQLRECVHQNHVFRARIIKDLVNPLYVAYYSNWPGAAYFELHAKQTTNLASINLTKLASFPVPLPPLAEQERIVAEVDRHLSRADALAASIAQAKRRAQRLRRAILAAAFQGRLVPQDPNDEPASVLLDRIRAQAATAEAATAATPRRGRPSAQPVAPVASASPPAMTPKRRGRPPGSKNKAKA